MKIRSKISILLTPSVFKTLKGFLRVLHSSLFPEVSVQSVQRLGQVKKVYSDEGVCVWQRRLVVGETTQ